MSGVISGASSRPEGSCRSVLRARRRRNKYVCSTFDLNGTDGKAALANEFAERVVRLVVDESLFGRRLVIVWDERVGFEVHHQAVDVDRREQP
jgi:hypothetical protein